VLCFPTGFIGSKIIKARLTNSPHRWISGKFSNPGKR
jgi:hypothetical protein